MEPLASQPQPEPQPQLCETDVVTDSDVAAAIRDVERKEKRNARDRKRSQLKKQSMEEMRDLVRQLERAKEQLEARYGASLRSPSSSLSLRNTSENVSPNITTNGDTQLTRAQEQYLLMLRHIEELRRENREMTLDLAQRDLARSAVQNLLEHLEKQALVEYRADDADTPMMPMLPDDQLLEIAERVHRDIITALCHSPLMMPFTGAQVLGWTDFRSRLGTSVNFAIRKTFLHQSTEVLAEKTWEYISDGVKMRRLIPSYLSVEFNEIQRLNDNIMIIDRRTLDRRWLGPSKPGQGRVQPPLRTTYMLYRGRDEDGGYMLAMKTVDLPVFKANIAEGEMWCNVFYWIYLKSETLPNGEVATVTYFGGALKYLMEEIARDWLVELVFLAIRWESVAVSSSLLRFGDDEED
ncbi:hypothetical protein Poli38472_014286 [Pythium oligandrum]|uniref:Uncharacterized protein n=1 Tax=Pythium oligandrum TaxID=41045 RepID=A0A8K1FKG5_PYTOL|nr:hypothetical protein Poli38472_014286 [Pythium oligandrum]|eukprot:TMW64169.1 hypothetical protein Poli38472_014286 [Pythium oligandrum]